MTIKTFGSDPEVFVSNGGEIVPAFDFLPDNVNAKLLAEKDARHNAHFINHSQFPYWDGFQAEFRTRAHRCRDELALDIRNGLWRILSLAPSGSVLDIRSVVEIPREILKGVDDKFAALGCDPSLNVYGYSPVSVLEPRRLKYRFAGYHFHFGFTDSNDLHNSSSRIIKIVQNLDASIGLIGVSLFENLDNPIRRKYYGRAGEFRLPPHGIEYRTLSSSVLVHPAIQHLLWDIGGRVVRMVDSTDTDLTTQIKSRDIQTVINTYDVTTARDMLIHNRSIFDLILQQSYGFDPKIIEFAWKTILQPVEETVSLNVSQNWQMDKAFIDHQTMRFSQLAGSDMDMEDLEHGEFENDIWVPFEEEIDEDDW